MPSELATYRVSPTKVIPKGEYRFEMKIDLVSATPSPFVSRSRTILFSLGTPPPPRARKTLKRNPLNPRLSSGRLGALVSATSTSPFGRTYSHRG